GGASVSGSWSMKENSVFLRLTLDGASWSGIVCRMQDDAGTDVTVFSLAGQNESVWGVKYDEAP
ncbi:MAG: arabinan endo-1,5-alpha-L-arabinosidase, partial [Clostridiales bacterium]|nr:arabinan endo-1,5-alpha-L-arabinosidase [Clostridiales bacterium]